MEKEPKAFVAYEGQTYTAEEQQVRAEAYLELLRTRRSVRAFSDKAVDAKLIATLIETAASAPSGANRQPYTFCAVSDPKIKRKIRIAAEKEEFINYHGRMDEQWLDDLKPLGTDWNKPFLETAPWLIVVFRQRKRSVAWADSVFTPSKSTLFWSPMSMTSQNTPSVRFTCVTV